MEDDKNPSPFLHVYRICVADNQQKVVDNWKSVKVQVRFFISIGYGRLITSRKLAIEAGDLFSCFCFWKRKVWRIKVHTNTFPVAIRNDSINSCVAFASSVNKARSLRKAGSSHDTQVEKKIIAIYAKKNGEQEFTETVYKKRDE